MSQALLVPYVSLVLAAAPAFPAAGQAVAVVEAVSGIAEIRVTYQDKRETVRFVTIAGEEELRKALHSANTTRVSKSDIERFLNNRALITNFLQTLMPTGSRVSLAGMSREPSGRICASVAFDYSTGDTFFIDLDSVVLSHGFGMPLPSLWDSTVDFDNVRVNRPQTRESPSTVLGMSLEEQLQMAKREISAFHTVSYFCDAYDCGKGLWADGNRKSPGVRTRPLPVDCDPSLAVPLLAVSFTPASGSKSSGASHRAEVTVICTRPCDVQHVARAARWITTMLHEYLSSHNDAVFKNESHISQLEEDLLSRLRSSKQWDTGTPQLARVQLRTLWTPAPLPE